MMNLSNVTRIDEKRHKKKHQISCDLDNALCIINSCNSTAHPSIKHYIRMILMKAISLFILIITQVNKRNLYKMFTILRR